MGYHADAPHVAGTTMIHRGYTKRSITTWMATATLTHLTSLTRGHAEKHIDSLPKMAETAKRDWVNWSISGG